jgi:hypothetical protein
MTALIQKPQIEQDVRPQYVPPRIQMITKQNKLIDDTTYLHFFHTKQNKLIDDAASTVDLYGKNAIVQENEEENYQTKPPVALNQAIRDLESRIDEYKRTNNLNVFTISQLRNIADKLNIPFKYDGPNNKNTSKNKLIEMITERNVKTNVIVEYAQNQLLNWKTGKNMIPSNPRGRPKKLKQNMMHNGFFVELVFHWHQFYHY